ncbi:MAG TPA: membrane protein insertion efficiency factor YidD [Steroidobacteraceae bacterium]|jgi:putative membrane protein insertion efficiency factor|nr:membrane protein insertion efficiency factor YidD [Steroidobacteraceae bacterium]
MLKPRQLFMWIIRGYQLVISPMLGPRCRFYPSCSCYAHTAIERYGIARGGWLGIRRLLRCHPFNAGGYDPVPEPTAADKRLTHA